MKNARNRVGLLAGLAFLAVAAVVCVLRFEVTTDITHFLPAGTDLRLVDISRSVARSELTRTIVLTVGSSREGEAGADDAARGATELAQRLRKSRHVAWVNNGAAEDLEKAVYDLYFPRRLSFLSEHPGAELPEKLSDAGLAAAAQELRRQIGLPTAPLVRRFAPEDPLLGFAGIIERLEEARADTLELRDGQLVTRTGQRGVVLLGSQGSAFHTATQRLVQQEIASAFAAVNGAHDERLDIAQSGAGRFAIASEQAIKADVMRISILSTVAIIVLFLGLFRSFRSLGLVLLPLAAGVLGAAAVGLLLFGRLHGLTLAFGSTLIGVCIDFAVHLQSHHALAPSADGPAATLRRIWPALILGALTTVAGLAGLAWTSLPGIREIAVFSSVGVLCALGATRLILPPLLSRKTTEPPRPLAWLAERLARTLKAMRHRRLYLALLPVAAIALCAVALPRIRWVDDLSALQNLDPELRAEDNRVREQISHVEAGRMVIALGATEEEALQRNDRVFARLRAARTAGEVGEFRSAHSLLWSAELQQQNRAQLAAAPRLFERTQAALDEAGFRPDLFAPFGEALAAEPVEPLRYRDLAESPLGDMVRPFRITVGDNVAFLTFLRDVRDAEGLTQRLADLDGVVYFDQLTFLGDTFRHCRTRTLQLMVVGLIAVLLMVLLRYRRLGLTAAAFAPSLLAAATTLAIVGLTGAPANLLHLLGLLLVLSMGVDYGVFMVESRDDPEQLAATAVGLLVACLSTVFAFGLLALSSNPALHAMGLTTGIGVLLSLVLAPAALLLVKGHHAEE